MKFCMAVQPLALYRQAQHLGWLKMLVQDMMEDLATDFSCWSLNHTAQASLLQAHCDRLHDACCFCLSVTCAMAKPPHACCYGRSCLCKRSGCMGCIACQSSQVEDDAKLAVTCKKCCSSMLFCAQKQARNRLRRMMHDCNPDKL
ncbi:TPA: hypothetical protein ACH3X2_003136 [Trebouxia sp. C0005]